MGLRTGSPAVMDLAPGSVGEAASLHRATGGSACGNGGPQEAGISAERERQMLTLSEWGCGMPRQKVWWGQVINSGCLCRLVPRGGQGHGNAPGTRICE